MHKFSHQLIFAAALALAGCTVSIPDADHFPEAQDVLTADTVPGKDAKDVAAADADVLDSKDAVGTDAIDVAPDAAHSDADSADADAAPPTDVSATTDAIDAAVDADDAAPDAAEVAEDAATDAVDVGPSCTPSQCDDGNPCTKDECGGQSDIDVGWPCVHWPLNAVPCPDDGLPCTGDVCANGTCSHSTLLPDWCIVAGTCFPSGTMSADNCATCAPATSPIAFTPLPDTATCSDGTACTVGDHCQAGACLPGSVTTCDDGNPCTADNCDTVSGCSNPNLDDGSGCPADGVCKLPGFCISGACSSSPKVWSTSMDGGSGGGDEWRGVVVTASGEIVATGTRELANGSQGGWAQRFSAAGDLLQELPDLSDPGDPALWWSLARNDAGELAFGGANNAGPLLTLLLLDGTQKKIKKFPAFGGVLRVVAAGSGWLAMQLDGVSRFDAAGATVWSAAISDGTSWRDLTPTPDGGAVVVGSNGNSAWAGRFTVSGTPVWQRTIGNPGDQFLGVCGDGAGGWFTAGVNIDGNPWIGRLDSHGGWLGAKTTVMATPPGVMAARFIEGGWRLVGNDPSAKAWQCAFDVAGNLLWQSGYDLGTLRDAAAFPDGGTALVGATTGSDGLVIRADPWGSADCATSKLCSNLTTSACDDSFSCTVDLCTASNCSHVSLDTKPCDDGDICTVVDTCVASQCSGGTDGLFDGTDASVSQWTHIAPRADGGAILSGSAGLVERVDASGASVWSHFVSGGAVSDVAALPNGEAYALQGDSGGTLTRFSDGGTAIGSSATVDGASGGKSTGLAVLSDDSLVVVGTGSVGTQNQAAFAERFVSGVGTPVTLPGNFDFSQGLAIAASSKSGCGVLTVEGPAAKIHRLDGDLNETWTKQLSLGTHVAIANLPDDGWLVAGPGPKGLALERYGPDGAFEFAEQWPVSGLTDVRALAVLPDGTCAVAVERLASGLNQGGIVRFGPLGGLLSIAWGADGSQLFDVATVVRPSGVWAIGSRSGGGWLYRTDSHGGISCASSGGCVSESLLCDDNNPCSNDGCAAGKCTSTAPTTASLCMDGSVCTLEGACPLTGKCGDGFCNNTENSKSCPGDCSGVCDAMTCDDTDPCTVDYCNSGGCQIGGALDGTACAIGMSCTFSKCAIPPCGDGLCASGETVSNCPADCPVCGDGLCGKGENNHLCPADCAKPASGCQNMCGWKSTKPGGGVCWCDSACTPGVDCCADKATFCP